MSYPLIKHSANNRWRHFAVVDTKPITEADARQIQEAAGFLVMGYSFEDFSSEPLMHLDKPTGQYYAEWKCYASCE